MNQITNQKYKNRIFPEGIEELSIVYSKTPINRATLRESAERLDGYQKIEFNPETKDGDWYCGLHFKTKEGTIAILFPWSRYQKRTKTTKLQRPIAVYKNGRTNKNFVNRTIEDLALELK